MSSFKDAKDSVNVIRANMAYDIDQIRKHIDQLRFYEDELNKIKKYHPGITIQSEKISITFDVPLADRKSVV